MIELAFVVENKPHLRLKTEKNDQLSALKELVYLSEPRNIAEL